jgi:hypothetical protein
MITIHIAIAIVALFLALVLGVVLGALWMRQKYRDRINRLAKKEEAIKAFLQVLNNFQTETPSIIEGLPQNSEVMITLIQKVASTISSLYGDSTIEPPSIEK